MQGYKSHTVSSLGCSPLALFFVFHPFKVAGLLCRQHGSVTAGQSHRQVPISIPSTSTKPLDSLPNSAEEAHCFAGSAPQCPDSTDLDPAFPGRPSCSAHTLVLHEGLAHGDAGLLSPTCLQPYFNSTGAVKYAETERSAVVCHGSGNLLRLGSEK